MGIGRRRWWVSMAVGEACGSAGDAAVQMDRMAVGRRRWWRRAREMGEVGVHADVAVALSFWLAEGVTERHGGR